MTKRKEDFPGRLSMDDTESRIRTDPRLFRVSSCITASPLVPASIGSGPGWSHGFLSPAPQRSWLTRCSPCALLALIHLDEAQSFSVLNSIHCEITKVYKKLGNYVPQGLQADCFQ